MEIYSQTIQRKKNPEAQKAAKLVAFELNDRKEKPSDDMILSVKRTASELLLNIYVKNCNLSHYFDQISQIILNRCGGIHSVHLT